MLEINETRRNAMLKINHVVFTLAGAALLLASSRALAVDGVIEINEAKVMAAGGFPYTISSSGSYRLTSNLMPSGGADGIHVDSGQVTLDLNGFTIAQGGATGGTGIQANSGKNAVTVRNGLVSGFANGIRLNDSSRIEAVQVLSNSDRGITCGDDCHVEHCIVKGNGTFGIYTGNHASITATIATGNGLVGFGFAVVVFRGSLLVGNTIASNYGGIDCQSASGFATNVLTDNNFINNENCTSLGQNLCDGNPC